MKRKTVLLISGGSIIFTMVCTSINRPLVSPVTPTDAQLLSPSLAANVPTATKSPIPSITPTSIPAWLSNFAEPILQVVANHQPDFEDDFTSTHKGWVMAFARYGREGTFAVENGVLRFKMGEGDAYAANDALNKKDYVLELDARMTEGDAQSRLQVYIKNQPTCCGYVLDLYSGIPAWDVDKSNIEDIAHDSKNVSPIGDVTHVIIIARGQQAAVYLNDTPVAYFKDPDFEALGPVMLFCWAPASPTVCEFDNVKFWNLNNMTDLP